MIRQGDVLIIPTSEKTNLPMRENKIELTGQRTGHTHALEADAAFETSEGVALVRLDANRTMTHPEHGSVSIPAGWHLIRQQREWRDGDLRRRWD